jgi:hypothetical protein
VKPLNILSENTASRGDLVELGNTGFKFFCWLNTYNPLHWCITKTHSSESFEYLPHVCYMMNRLHIVIHYYFIVIEQRNILHEIWKQKASWIGHILCRNCLLKQVIEGKIKGEMEVTRRRGRRRKKLLDDLKDRRRCSHLKEETLDCTMWRNCFGRDFGPVVRQNTELWMITSPKAISFSLMNFEGPEHGQNCTCCMDPWCRVWINQRVEDINAYFYGLLIVEALMWCSKSGQARTGSMNWCLRLWHVEIQGYYKRNKHFQHYQNC